MAIACTPGTESASCGTLSYGGLIGHQESVYTQEHLEQYLDKIGYHKHKHLVENSFDAPLIRLQLLMRLHLIAFPFENTVMHYSKDHVLDISPESLFQRLVVDGIGGSYCFGHNTLFLGMLRRLGYRVYPASARSLMEHTDDAPLPAWSHMILFVQPFENSPTTYLIDVGWGGLGQMRPILLSDHHENTVQGTTSTERHRLVKVVLPRFALPAPSWRLERTSNPHEPNPTWKPLHMFTEGEVYPADFIASSYALCCLPGDASVLRVSVYAVKYFFVNPEDPLESDIGRCMLWARVVKRGVGAVSEVLKTFGEGEEKERIAALKEYAGIDIGEEGEKYIMDTPAHL